MTQEVMNEDSFYSILADGVFSRVYSSQSKRLVKWSGARPRERLQLGYSWSRKEGYGGGGDQSLSLLPRSAELKNQWIVSLNGNVPAVSGKQGGVCVF